MDAPSRPDPRPAPPEATIDDLFALTTFDYPLEIGGTVKVLKFQRLDAFTRFMQDIMPMPLFEAASKVIQRIAEQSDEAGKAKAFAALDPDERALTLDMLRRNAVAVSFRPKLSLDGAPGTFPVALLDVVTLLRIYHENPPDSPVARLEVAAAETFRPGTADAPDPAGPDGEALQPAAQSLAAAGVGA